MSVVVTRDTYEALAATIARSRALEKQFALHDDLLERVTRMEYKLALTVGKLSPRDGENVYTQLLMEENRKLGYERLLQKHDAVKALLEQETQRV